MAIEVRVPSLGESVTEATIGQWFKKVGDAVAADEMILDIGPQTAESFAQLLTRAGTIVWNGPVGVFEFAAFETYAGTYVQAIGERADGAAEDTRNHLVLAKVKPGQLTFASSGIGATCSS